MRFYLRQRFGGRLGRYTVNRTCIPRDGAAACPVFDLLGLGAAPTPYTFREAVVSESIIVRGPCKMANWAMKIPINIETQ